MVFELKTVAVTKKQVEKKEVAEIKMLRFAMVVTRKDKIKNEYIRGTVKVERMNDDDGHVMRRDQGYVRRKVMEMELSGKKKRGRPKRRFLDVVKKDMGEVGARERAIENRTFWRNIIRCGYP